MPVSVRGAGAPRTGAEELHRQCFASVGQCAGAQIWPRLACASCWISRRLRLGLAAVFVAVCGARPLRPPASLLHNAALPSVPASRYAKAPLGAGHRCAPYRVKATGVMQSGLRWCRSHSRWRFPVVGTPYAPPSERPCGCRGTVASVRRCALCAWSVAYGQSCGVCPRPPLCFAAARHQPARWSARPPPWGLPQPARLGFWVLLQV